MLLLPFCATLVLLCYSFPSVLLLESDASLVNGCLYGVVVAELAPLAVGPGPGLYFFFFLNHSSAGRCVQCWVLVYLAGACLVVCLLVLLSDASLVIGCFHGAVVGPGRGPGPFCNHSSVGRCVQCWVLVYMSGACLVLCMLLL